MLLLLFFTSCLGLSGHFLQISDVHLDLNYEANTTIINSACHSGKGNAARFGERWYCDSPATLFEQTMELLSTLSISFDFVLLTGDNARHDDDAKLPRTFLEVIHENTIVVEKISKYFPNMAIIPSIGNNDVFPHDTLDPPGKNNKVLPALADAWNPILTGQQRQMMLQGGWLSRKINNLIVISLNTIYPTYEDDCNATQSASLAQMEWLASQLQNAKSNKETVLITGHIPPAKWKAGCRSIYASLGVSFAHVITGHLFGHLHRDTFFLMNKNGDVNPNKMDPGSSIAMLCAPSVVPSYNPSFRVYKYSTSDYSLRNYYQFYANIDRLNTHSENFQFFEEYDLLETYGIKGSAESGISGVHFWIELFNLIQTNKETAEKFGFYEYVESRPIHNNTNTSNDSFKCSKRPLLCKDTK